MSDENKDQQPRKYGLGWLRDQPDIRDLHVDSPEVTQLFANSNVRSLSALSSHESKNNNNKRAKGMSSSPLKDGPAPALPTSVSLVQYFSAIEDQGNLGSCTAHAGVGMYEYYMNRKANKVTDLSRLFLYKVTRNLLKWKGDTGAYLRTTMKALAAFGAPPEDYYPYVISKFDEEPSAFAYNLAQSFQALTYYRLDPAGTPPDTILARGKASIAAQQPFMFGFTVYDSIWSAKNGDIPFPGPKDKVAGGHAIVAAGYDDNKVIGKYTGAFLIRNSWGTGWGLKGYGYIPYEYFLQGQADDLWCMTSAEILNLVQFD